MHHRLQFWLTGLMIALAIGSAYGAGSSSANGPVETTATDHPSTPTLKPIQPTWEQLMNGGLESQFVEVRGMVGRVQNRDDGWTVMTLHTIQGDLKTILLRNAIQGGPLENRERSLVRLRGHLMVDRDPATERVITGQIRMQDPEILVDCESPTDLFSLPLQSAASLTHANPDHAPFAWVKVSGQIIQVRSRLFFMMDHGTGLRFVTDDFPNLQSGDLVEVVGYQDVLTAAAPKLLAAVARKIGEAPLPEARSLSNSDLISPGFDSTLVRVIGTLTDLKRNKNELVLEMRSGDWRYWSRLNVENISPPPLKIGSRLELTGTYCAQGEYKVIGPDVAALDLFLNSPAGIKVLSTPPWWTLQRLLMLVGVLVCLLMATLLWITLLHRKVEQRTAELSVQIHEREHVEHLRAMEQERARIAQDLHDQLGSDITAVGMLVERTKFNRASDEQRAHYMEQLGETARAMVSTLDEIVWAMNPQHDSLASLVGYLGGFAERFLALANITLRLDVPSKLPAMPLSSRLRHQLFMVFKEALANVVHHAAATAVSIRVTVEDNELCCVVADNGHGLPPGNRDESMSGLANMKERIEKYGGCFNMESAAERGTTLRFKVPLN